MSVFYQGYSPVVNQCDQLSAGTVANLIGRPDYTAIDAWRVEFAAYVRRCEDAGVVFGCWQDAYQAFTNSHRILSTMTLNNFDGKY